jgi:ABC-type sugar transport system substrate-binding protein
VSLRLEWHETAPGLLFEASGAGGRRYVIAADGDNWTLDFLIDGEYATEQAVDPQPASTLDQAMQMAQKLESELW